MTAIASAPPTDDRPLRCAANGWQSLGVFLLTLSVFLLLPQRVLHGVDADVFIAWVAQGQHDYPRHFAYLHVAGAFYALVAPLGGNAYHALLLASAVGSATAAMLLHRAFVLLSPRSYRCGVLPALAVAATGPCFYFATCVEIHGVFAAAAAAAWLAFAHLLRRPTAVAAVVVGAATGGSAALHAFGHLLLPTLVLAGWAAGAHRRGVRLVWIPVAGAAHAAVAIGLAALLAGPGNAQSADVVPYLASLLPTFDAGSAPAVLWREWLLPCLPWSLLAPIGLFSRRARPWAIAALIGLAVHLPLTVLLLGHHGIVELGAYMIGIVPAAVMAASRLLRPRGFAVATAIALMLSLAATAPRWHEPTAPNFAAGVRELAAQAPVTLIVGRRHELDGVRRALPHLVVMDLAAVWQVWDHERKDGRTFAQWFDGWYPTFTADGKRLLLSDSARDFFACADIPEIRDFWDRHAAHAYERVQVRRGGFAGTFLLPPKSVAVR
ncbi:MAG: hypothetical protein RL398_3567 [Planctomycetota bacterium]|jgi:hypothetical protein